MISTVKFITSLAIVSALLVGSAASFAKDGDGRVLRTGDCSGRSDWKLKAKHEDGRIETEFEVDQNRNGVTWRYRLRRNGTTVARGTRVTRAPSGSFEVERRIGNPPGTDRITAVATRRGGETCRASLRIQAAQRKAPSRSRSRSVPATDTSTEPAQPSLFEKRNT